MGKSDLAQRWVDEIAALCHPPGCLLVRRLARKNAHG